MKQLIVNADDFGLTAGVTEGILDAHREGIVTSATLMAKGAAFDLAVEVSRRAPGLGVGVHLNLSEGIPVSPPGRIMTLVDHRGRLHFTPGRLLQALLRRSINLDEVEAELRAQIAKVVRAGISPTHLDGHKHVHVLPGVADIVIRLAMEFGIPSVRCPLEGPLGFPNPVGARKSGGAPLLKQYLVSRAVSAFAWQFRRKLAEASLRCPAQFYGLSYTGFLDALSIQDLLDRLPEGTSELMCHPGYSDASLVSTGTRLLIEREVELFALCSPLIKTLVTSQGIRLVHYQSLAGREPSGVRAA
jgi:chitin disaccharide deacetylase